MNHLSIKCPLQADMLIEKEKLLQIYKRTPGLARQEYNSMTSLYQIRSFINQDSNAAKFFATHEALGINPFEKLEKKISEFFNSKSL